MGLSNSTPLRRDVLVLIIESPGSRFTPGITASPLSPSRFLHSYSRLRRDTPRALRRRCGGGRGDATAALLGRIYFVSFGEIRREKKKQNKEERKGLEGSGK